MTCWNQLARTLWLQQTFLKPLSLPLATQKLFGPLDCQTRSQWTQQCLRSQFGPPKVVNWEKGYQEESRNLDLYPRKYYWCKWGLLRMFYLLGLLCKSELTKWALSIEGNRKKKALRLKIWWKSLLIEQLNPISEETKLSGREIWKSCPKVWERW